MEFTAQQLASFLEGEVVGDTNVKVNNISKIEEGKPGTLAFLSNPKYSHYLYSTEASIVLVNKDFCIEKDVQATLIKVDDAYQSVAVLLQMVVDSQAPRMGIEQPSYISEDAELHEDVYVGAFAYIDKKSKIGKNSKVYPHVFVGRNVTIGDYCCIYPGVKIYSNTVIGNNVTIQAGAVIGSDGFGFAPNNSSGEYKKIPQIGNVIIEDYVEIGANTTIDCATFGSTIIRRGVKLDNLIQIGHNCEVGENTVMAGQVGLAGSTKMGKQCMVGGQVGIAGHITIGDNTMLAAQSGITNNLEGGKSYFGSPAMEASKAKKIFVIQRNLDKLLSDVNELKRHNKTQE
ncbi:MAG: UDP-3-O-(3-hydroxymyristoyl)glucosamine N-acyltransferase [Bacteroidales bacterium]